MAPGGEYAPLWRRGETTLLYLGPPIFRGGAEGASRSRKNGVRYGEHREWSVREREWQSAVGPLAMTVSIEEPGTGPQGESMALTIRVVATSACVVERCAFELVAPCVEPPLFVDRCAAWGPLRHRASLNDFGPLAVRWRGEKDLSMELRSLQGTTSSSLSWNQRTLRIIVDIDAAALHPRWQFAGGKTLSTAATAWQPGAGLDVRLLLRLAGDDPPAVLSRFPEGTEAAFVLTDHCDFDNTERLRIFLDGDAGGHRGWLGRGLKMTKGVFALPSSRVPRAAAPTLSDALYTNLIRRLWEDGSEIVPHGLNESGNIPPATFAETLRAFAAQWSPATWIDHGSTLMYCYTMGGADNPDFELLRHLRERGFTALWSYHDAPVQAAGSLNLLAAPPLSALRDFSLAATHVAQGELLVALHYLRSFIKTRVTGTWGRLLSELMSALRGVGMSWSRGSTLTRQDLHRAWDRISRASRAVVSSGAERTEKSLPYTSEELRQTGAVAFPERGVPLHEATIDDILLFVTMEVLHVRDAFTPNALKRLVHERGVHIGHCYLLNDLPYVAGVFGPPAEIPVLTRAWAEFLECLTTFVSSRQIWNPTMAGFSGWIAKYQSLTMIPSGPSSAIVRNPLGDEAGGVTLLLPPGVSPASVRWGHVAPAGIRRWRDWLAVWGDVPAWGEVAVAWESPSSTPR